MTFLHWVVANWGKITAVAILILKWAYNAWQPGVTFPQFCRLFIGEVVQEAPQNQQKALEEHHV